MRKSSNQYYDSICVRALYSFYIIIFILLLFSKNNFLIISTPLDMFMIIKI